MQFCPGASAEYETVPILLALALRLQTRYCVGRSATPVLHIAFLILQIKEGYSHSLSSYPGRRLQALCIRDPA